MKKVKKIIKKILSFKNYILLILNKVTIGKSDHIVGKLFIRNKGTFIIGNNCCFRSGIRENPVGIHHNLIFDIKPNAILKIGNNVGISNAIIVSSKKIIIEDDVMIGGSVQIYDSNHHSLNYNKRISNYDDDIKTNPIILKKGCFIGVNSIILKGVTIGEKSIVGAGSVVTKSIPDNEIWAGNPAKFIKKIEGVDYEKNNSSSSK